MSFQGIASVNKPLTGPPIAGSPATIAALAAAETLTLDSARARDWYYNEPIADYGNRTAAELVDSGHLDAILAFLDDLGNGANG